MCNKCNKLPPEWGAVINKLIDIQNMYNQNTMNKSELKGEDRQVGETIEQKVERIMSNKEPITDGAELQFTERKDGVRPEYDIRTDRWDMAVDAMDKVDGSRKAKRENLAKMEVEKGGLNPNNDNSIQGKGNEPTSL